MSKPKKRKMSKQGRENIRKGIKERWARVKAAKMGAAAARMVDSLDKAVAARNSSCLSHVETAESSLAGSANTKQIGGDHYKDFEIEPWDFNIVNNLPFMEGSIVSYICRWRHKGGIQDLEKAKHYIEKMIEVEEERTTIDGLSLKSPKKA